jgi:selenocysteine lyase/cysteine desulfurase
MKGASQTFEALIGECDQVRKDFADFIGASPEEVAMMDTTSMAISTIANGLDWNHGDSVVIPQIEYLSNVYPWLNLASKGVEIRRVPCPNGRVLVDDLINACDSKTRVLSVSSVQFSNGYRVDLSTLGEACRSRNIMLVVDANHTVGAFAFQVKDLPIDAMATQSFKWLCGPYNTGWLYIRKELIESIRPSAVGPLSALPSESFLDTRFCLRTDAGRFETGVLNFAGIIGAGASLRYFKSIRMDVIENRVIHLTDYLTEGLLSKGYKVLSARQEPWERSGIVICRHPRPDTIPLHIPDKKSGDLKDGKKARSKGLDRRGDNPWHAACLNRLANEGIVISMREGALRISPHFYNTEEEVDELLAALP